MPSSGARTGAIVLALVLSVSGLPSPVEAQGTRNAPGTVARGKSLAEWIEQTDHYIPELRREAIKAIAALGSGARQALPVLIRATRDENEEVRFWAVEALRRLGPSARPATLALIVVLTDDTRQVQEAARRALEAIGQAAAPALLPALEARDPWLRANAAEALGVIGESKGSIVSGLSHLLSDDSLWVRASAAWALGHLGLGAKRAAKPLGSALAQELQRDPTLADPTQRVRVVNLVYALGRVGKAANPAIPLVMSVLYDGDDSLRSVAAEALAGIGSKAAQPAGRAVREGRMPVRLAAARAVRLMGPQGRPALADLIQVLETRDELEGGHQLVIATADALGAMGKKAKPALKVLERQRRQSVTPDVVAALERALRKIRLGV